MLKYVRKFLGLTKRAKTKSLHQARRRHFKTYVREESGSKSAAILSCAEAILGGIAEIIARLPPPPDVDDQSDADAPSEAEEKNLGIEEDCA